MLSKEKTATLFCLFSIRIGLPLIYSAEELGVACVTIASKMMSLDVASEDTQIISNCSVRFLSMK